MAKYPVKLIVSSKAKMVFKYGSQSSGIEKLLKELTKADKTDKSLDTRVVWVDDAVSCKAAGVKKVTSLSERECKRIVDDLYKKLTPAYIVILGAGDVFPFQELNNPADDDDSTVPSDLPYACESPYSRSVHNFTGPARVVGRIPDRPGRQPDISYLETIIRNAMRHKPLPPDEYRKYFSVTAQVWKKSTEMSLQSMFSDATHLVSSPVQNEKTDAKYSKTQLKPRTHFYNCHGTPADPCYYGQRGQNFPVALRSTNIKMNITAGTVAAAECCYGAQLYNASNAETQTESICHTYLGNGAVGFVGSSTIAYGPADSNALADLITQFFICNILKGASTGRAFLEARQRFLSESGPQLDPYELKTLAQFYLLGDPSVSPALSDDIATTKILSSNSIANSRLSLQIKGASLQQSIAPSKKMKANPRSGNVKEMNHILAQAGFEKTAKVHVYAVAPKPGASPLQKQLTGRNARFRTFIQPRKSAGFFDVKVLVVKEEKDQILGWRVYESR